MALNLLQTKLDYLRKILNVSLNNQRYSTVIFNSSFPFDNSIEIIEKLKDEYHIDSIIIIDFDNDKIKSFYESNPSKEQIEQFIPKFPKINGNIKRIFLSNSITDLSTKYNSDYSIKYYEHLKEYNKELFDKIENLPQSNITVTVYPNEEWAKSFLEGPDELDKLWLKISKTLLNPEEAKKEIEQRMYRKNELNGMKIHNLYFYTNLGTDFKISLNSHSIWSCEPNKIDGIYNFFNFPSYEIYTSPNCYSAEGKIVLSKKSSFYYDTLIENAIFEFSKGKLISSKSNSQLFDYIVLHKPNKMNRIGEIALVSNDSPLALTSEFYNSTILDENAGCHFALGYAIDDCIGVDKEKLKEKGYRYYRYNTSNYHNDFVFGNDSISIEAELKGKKKVLLMEKGIWKI